MEKVEYKRSDEISTLLEIIENSDVYRENSENGLVIMINGQWGSGKSVFLKQLQEEIKYSQKYELFSEYNSWEYDFYENAYIPFFCNIESQKDMPKIIRELINVTSKQITKNSVIFINKITKNFIKNNIGIDFDEWKNIAHDIKNDIDSDKNYLEDFENFKRIKEKINSELNSSTFKKRLFMIDELDRCNPKFAIDTLEIIKHFFDVKDMIFIVAVDKRQLSHSVKTIFGQMMNSDLYFSKFFDYQFNLPSLSIDSLIQYGMGIDSSKEYCKMLKKLNISIRDSSKILNEVRMKNRELDRNVYIEKTLNGIPEEYTPLKNKVIFILILLKYTDLLLLNMLLDGNYKKVFGELLENDINYIKYKSVFDNDIIMFFNLYALKKDNIYILDVKKSNSNQTVKISENKNINDYLIFLKPNISYRETVELILQ